MPTASRRPGTRLALCQSGLEGSLRRSHDRQGRPPERGGAAGNRAAEPSEGDWHARNAIAESSESGRGRRDSRSGGFGKRVAPAEGRSEGLQQRARSRQSGRDGVRSAIAARAPATGLDDAGERSGGPREARKCARAREWTTPERPGPEAGTIPEPDSRWGPCLVASSPRPTSNEGQMRIATACGIAVFLLCSARRGASGNRRAATLSGGRASVSPNSRTSTSASGGPLVRRCVRGAFFKWKVTSDSWSTEARQACEPESLGRCATQRRASISTRWPSRDTGRWRASSCRNTTGESTRPGRRLRVFSTSQR